MPATASTPAWSTCRPRPCATAWPSWSGSIPISRRSSSSPRRSRSTTRARSAPWARPTASTSSAPTAWAWPTPGTGCGSAARSAATIPARPCSRARSRSSPTPATSPPRSPTIWPPPAGAPRPRSPAARTSTSTSPHPSSSTRCGNDERSKAAVMYAEPGGYYELGLQSKKPIVACVVGRWKAKLTRAVGHAGAMAGSGDDAASKEALVHGDVRRRRHVHARTTRSARPRVRWSPTSPTSRRR